MGSGTLNKYGSDEEGLSSTCSSCDVKIPVRVGRRVKPSTRLVSPLSTYITRMKGKELQVLVSELFTNCIFASVHRLMFLID